MPLFTFARLDPNDDINVTTVIAATNRSLETEFPECTIQVIDSGDYGTPSQWVTVDLDFTAAMLGCLEWYTTELTSKRVALQQGVKRTNPEPHAAPESNVFALLGSHVFDRRLA